MIRLHPCGFNFKPRQFGSELTTGPVCHPGPHQIASLRLHAITIYCANNMSTYASRCLWEGGDHTKEMAFFWLIHMYVSSCWCLMCLQYSMSYINSCLQSAWRNSVNSNHPQQRLERQHKPIRFAGNCLDAATGSSQTLLEKRVTQKIPFSC
jgi:hypothetical protein